MFIAALSIIVMAARGQRGARESCTSKETDREFFNLLSLRKFVCCKFHPPENNAPPHAPPRRFYNRPNELNLLRVIYVVTLQKWIGKY
jgi:hypothetical protein